MAINVLIVDDSITVRAVLQKALRLTGLDIAEIVQAANGVEALQVLNDRNIDFVFTDIIMSEMNGEQFVAQLHAEGRTADLPIVVISSAGDPERIKRLREMGVRGFVHKPFTPEQIKDAVIEHTGVETI